MIDHSDIEPFERDRWDRPLIADPETGEIKAYMRASRFAGLLTDKYLKGWHQWWAIKAAALHPTEAAAIAAAPSQKGQTAAIDAITHQAGMNVKRDKGQARHTLVRWALTGRPLPEGMTDKQREQLAHVVDVIHGLGTIDAVEVPLVCDEFQVAGQADYIGTGTDGPFVGDLKTGSFYKGGSGVEWGLQLIAYARSQRWDAQGKRRLGWVAPTLPRLHIVHAPQDNPATVTVYSFDPEKCMKLARAALAVRDARLIDPIRSTL